ncbi:hypothetical protein PABG_11522 [Paracoccidioides brasiliensis Pb03]|nr:hypothetical protein PABG_11522 [Paracoccidioides brasiliensis Pb03]
MTSLKPLGSNQERFFNTSAPHQLPHPGYQGQGGNQALNIHISATPGCASPSGHSTNGCRGDASGQPMNV